MAQDVGGALARPWRKLERPLFVGLASLVIAVTALLPLLSLAGGLAHAGAAGMSVLVSPRPWVLLGRSILLAVLVTTGALLAGVPLGVVFARIRFPMRRALFAAHAVPMLLPPFLPALGWFHLLGRQGILGSEATARLLFSPAGAVLILVLTFAPIVTSLTALGVLGIDPSLEEAARLVARPLRVMTRILVPAASPAIVLAALVVFTLTLSELGVPMFLRVDVYPAAVFARLGGIDYAPGEAAALVLPLVPIALGLVAIERRFLGRRAFTVMGLRDASRALLDAGRATPLITVACFSAAAPSTLPIFALMLGAARGGGFRDALASMDTSPWNSLLTAGLAATVIAAVAVILGHGLARRSVDAGFADGVALLSFFLPSAVLGVGLIAVWNRAPTQLIYGSLAIVVIGFIARYAVVGLRVFAAAVAQSPLSYEEAAMTSGAGYTRRLLRIVLPMHRRAAVAAWLLALVFCLRDLETAVLFYPPGGAPLTVRIFTLEANGPPAVVAALAAVHVGLTLVAVLLGSMLLRGGGPS